MNHTFPSHSYLRRCARLALTLLSFWLLLFTARAETAARFSAEEIDGRVRAGIAKLNAEYWSPTLSIWLDRPGDDLRAHYEGRLNPPWWPSANAVEVLIDFMNRTGSTEYDATIAALYDLQKDRRAQRARVVAELKKRQQWSGRDEKAWQERAEKEGTNPPVANGYYSDFQNEYLDDSAWWAITWLKMYERTHEPKYLGTAKTIQAHMAKNWKPEKDGGIVWCEDADKQRPNSITNSLFVILSARLHRITHEPAYLQDAQTTVAWLRERAVYDGTGVVDAPGHRGDYWSYNQGAYVGGLTALYEATGDAAWLEEAVKVAETVLHRSGLVLPTGVVIEKLGTSGDACLFKGVFVRYFSHLRAVLRSHQVHAELADEIQRDIRASVESMLENSTTENGLYTAEWHAGAKDRRANFNTQVSALAALVEYGK